MRAERLLSLMLLLQANGQMTANQLSKALYVSERTIYRDIDALGLAGIPIYTQDGRGGGVALEENYRVSLTGLNKNEIQALFVSGASAPLDDLGLGQANETILLKLLANLPSLHQAEAERVRQRIYIDPNDWFSTRQPSSFLPLLQEAVLSDAILNIQYQRTNGETFDREIQAYGMVAKSNMWYLIGAHEHNIRTYRVSRLVDVQPTGTLFTRDPNFNLIQYWQANAQSFVDSLPQYPVRLAIKASYRNRLKHHPLLSASDFVPMDDPDWLEFTTIFDTQQQAIMALMGMAREIRVLDPPDLKIALMEYAREVYEFFNETY